MRRRPATRSLAQQAFALRARHPGGRIQLCPNALHWTCELTPSALSRSYTVELCYSCGEHPRVRVLKPLLDVRLGESRPHVFRNGSLCLYRDGEWSSSMLLADTIVLWSAEWLFFYELWVPGGEWYGGGEWPPSRELGCPAASRRERRQRALAASERRKRRIRQRLPADA
jgi:hypothetical protein